MHFHFSCSDIFIINKTGLYAGCSVRNLPIHWPHSGRTLNQSWMQTWFYSTSAVSFALTPTSPSALAITGLLGCGTSLSAPHAAERALTELVQLRLSATRADTARHLERQWRHLAPFPRLQRCLHLDIDGLMSKSRQQCVTLPADCEHRTLDEQIRVIAHNVRSHNRELGISILYQTDSGTTLANVVIPGLERFYIVSTGNVVIPQARGQALNECYG